MQLVYYVLCFFCLTLVSLEAKKGSHISQEVMQEVRPYLMTNKHPIKKKLDQLFSKKRAIQDEASLKEAGFTNNSVRKWTQLVVTKHPKFPGYIFKIYLDKSAYYKRKPEHYSWILRIQGAEKIRNYISQHHLSHLFKVPKKWIYQLPKKPAPTKGSLEKYFILVEEDMNLHKNEENIRLWGSSLVNAEFLGAFYRVVTDLGLFDCAKPANASFAQDGKVAFIDTQTWGKPTVNYARMIPFLSDEMRIYWNHLIHELREAF